MPFRYQLIDHPIMMVLHQKLADLKIEHYFKNGNTSPDNVAVRNSMKLSDNDLPVLAVARNTPPGVVS